MAAPSGTVWGSIVNGSSSGRKGRLGIYTSISNTDTKTTVNVQVWFWTIYSCSDGASNTLYYNAGTGVTAASTVAASNIDITHTVATGSGWNTANQTCVYTKTHTHNRGAADTKHNIYAKFSGIDMLYDAVSVNTSYTVPALKSYTVSYDANGGSGAPSPQKKLHDQTLTLSDTTPDKTGYNFSRWLSSAQNQYYDPGDFYGHNADTTMIAQWTVKKYTVSFDANGGSGAPDNQAKEHGTDLILSSKIPTRENYTFLGWGTSSSSTTVSYKAGDKYSTNAAIKLFAVWQLAYTKPRITGLSVTRCDSTGKPAEEGTYALVKFTWQTYESVTKITVDWTSSSTEPGSEPINASGTSGSVSKKLTNEFSADATYTMRVTVADSKDSSNDTATLTGTAFEIDFLAGGGGVTFGGPAEEEGFHCLMDSYFKKGISIRGVPVRAKRCVVGQNTSTSTNPWYKYASVTASALNEDMRISFKVTFSYGTTTRFAILNANIRTANINGANAVQRLEFESDTGLDLSNFVMAYSGTGAGSVYELWVKLTSYRFAHFEVLSETNRITFTDNWKLYNQVSAGYAEAPTSGYALVTATRPYLLNAYPVGSVVIRYDSTSPADVFGGTWQRIEGRILYGCASSGTVGATGTHTTGSGSSSLPYVNVAIWRRTA